MIAGSLAVAWVLWSAIRTVVVPRGESVWLSRKVFLVVREVFEFAGRRTRSYEGYDRIMARYAPTSLILLPAAWALIVLISFVPMYWALRGRARGARPSSPAARRSRRSASPGPAASAPTSSASCRRPSGCSSSPCSSATCPAIYGAFSRREASVMKLEVRAGSPPSAEEFLIRVHRIRGLEYFATQWEEWENWFVEIEESHTSQPSLPFFRSTRTQSSWITSAGTVMDTAVAHGVVPRRRAEPPGPDHDALRLPRPAGHLHRFRLPYDPDPAPDDPISIDRAEYDELMDRLVDAGLPVKQDLDQAWRDFAGWRVNYDETLLRICALVSAPPAPWSSDRVERSAGPRARCGSAARPTDPTARSDRSGRPTGRPPRTRPTDLGRPEPRISPRGDRATRDATPGSG